MASSNIVTTLVTALPGKVLLPGSNAYTSSNESYFSALANEVAPACIVQPTSAVEVAEVIKTLKSTLSGPDGTAPLAAIRGAGHMTYPGSANVQGGVTIDMRGLKGVRISDDKKSVSIAAGENWGEVYRALEPEGLTAAGARVPTVGATGLVLAGPSTSISALGGRTRSANDQLTSCRRPLILLWQERLLV